VRSRLAGDGAEEGIMTNHVNILHFGTKRGDVEIREDELATITDADLRKLKVSRPAYKRRPQ
jgi:hypothetical protein